MRQETTPAKNKASSPLLHSPSPATRFGVAKSKLDGPMPDATITNRGTKQAPPGASGLQAPPRRTLLLTRVSTAEDLAGSPNRSGGRGVERDARLRRKGGDGDCKGGGREELEEKVRRLQRRLEEKEGLVGELRRELSAHQANLEKLQSLNLELDSHNKRLAADLCTANSQISALQRVNQVGSVNKLEGDRFADVGKSMSDKLKNQTTTVLLLPEDPQTTDMRTTAGTTVPDTSPAKPADGVEQRRPCVKPPPSPLSGLLTIRHGSAGGRPPPPPPPPPPASKFRSAKAANAHKSTPLVEFYHSLKRCSKETGTLLGGGGGGGSRSSDAHCSIVGELQNRSAHLLAIKSDVETKRNLIELLIRKVQSAAYADMDDVVAFVDWLDQELSTLADERAVLKHFNNWPERKADALREAAVEYRDLKRLETEIYAFEDDASVPCEAALKKIASLLDRLERQVLRFTKLRDNTLLSYRDWKIPTDWMLDAGVITQLRVASMKLAKSYMKRVRLESAQQYWDRASTKEALLLRGVDFAYRVHQFAGGLDSETMSAFEEVRRGLAAHSHTKICFPSLNRFMT